MSKMSRLRYKLDNEKARRAVLSSDVCPYEEGTRLKRLWFKWKKSMEKSKDIFESRDLC